MAKKPVMYTRWAKSISYGALRNLKTVTALVFHYTGNTDDTAKNNVDYFATGNDREAGAHFFVDRDGNIGWSIPIKRAAYAVGGKYSVSNGAGSYYGKVTNANSVSIELCDCANKAPGWKQMLACRRLYLWLTKEKCPNIKTVIRHWDVNGKACPVRMTGKNNKEWEHFLNKVTLNYQYKARVAKKAVIRSSKGVKPNNNTGTGEVGTTVKISKESGNWGRLLGKDSKGRWQWISLKKVKEV